MKHRTNQDIRTHPCIYKKHTLEIQVRFAESSAEKGSETYTLCHPLEALSSHPKKYYSSFFFCLEIGLSIFIQNILYSKERRQQWLFKLVESLACLQERKSGCGPTHMKRTSYSIRKEKKNARVQQIAVAEELFQINSAM